MGQLVTVDVTTDPKTLARMFRRLDREGCPAATLPAAGGEEGFSLVCGVIERENRDSHEEVRQNVDAIVSERREPGTIHGYCTTRGYLNCPTWRSEVARRDKGADSLDAADANYGGVGNRL